LTFVLDLPGCVFCAYFFLLMAIGLGSCCFSLSLFSSLGVHGDRVFTLLCSGANGLSGGSPRFVDDFRIFFSPWSFHCISSFASPSGVAVISTLFLPWCVYLFLIFFYTVPFFGESLFRQVELRFLLFCKLKLDQVLFCCSL